MRILVCILGILAATGCGWSPNETFGDFDRPDVIIPQPGNGIEGGSAVSGGLIVGVWPDGSVVDGASPARFGTVQNIASWPGSPSTGPSGAPPQPPHRIAHGTVRDGDFLPGVWLDPIPIEEWDETVRGNDVVYNWIPWTMELLGEEVRFEVDGALPPTDRADLNGSAVGLIVGGRYRAVADSALGSARPFELWCPGHPGLAFPCVAWEAAVSDPQFFRCFNLRNGPRQVPCQGYGPSVGIQATHLPNPDFEATTDELGSVE